MKIKNIAITIVIAIAFMTVAVWARPSQLTSKVQKWEYKSISSIRIESQLNILGEDGWELAAIQPVNNIGAVYVFKRPKN